MRPHHSHWTNRHWRKLHGRTKTQSGSATLSMNLLLHKLFRNSLQPHKGKDLFENLFYINYFSSVLWYKTNTLWAATNSTIIGTFPQPIISLEPHTTRSNQGWHYFTGSIQQDLSHIWYRPTFTKSPRIGWLAWPECPSRECTSNRGGNCQQQNRSSYSNLDGTNGK